MQKAYGHARFYSQLARARKARRASSNPSSVTAVPWVANVAIIHGSKEILQDAPGLGLRPTPSTNNTQFGAAAPGIFVALTHANRKVQRHGCLLACLLSGHWVKMTDVSAYLGAVGPHLEMMRFMKPEGLAGPPDDGAYEVRGDVVIHPEATVGAGSVLGPRVVVGKGCVVGEGCRLEGSTLLEGARVQPHTIVKDSLVGWRSVIGGWSHVVSSVFGEEVCVDEGLLVRGATVLPHKELHESVRTAQIVI